jgi:hypothetical protein
LEELEISMPKRHLHSFVHCNTIYNSQNMETAQVFISKGIKKKQKYDIYLHNRIVFSLNKQENGVIF